MQPCCLEVYLQRWKVAASLRGESPCLHLVNQGAPSINGISNTDTAACRPASELTETCFDNHYSRVVTSSILVTESKVDHPCRSALGGPMHSFGIGRHPSTVGDKQEVRIWLASPSWDHHSVKD